jgi:peptide subunit release factor 1 (eRF1)
VYLDIDQSNTANLNRKFETAFESKIKELGRTFDEEYEQRDFDGCVTEVRKTLAAYEPRAHGLVVFARSTGAIWLRELNVPIATEMFWGRSPHVQQFLQALDEFETYGVVLTDRSHSRIFTVKLGTIQKHAEIRAAQGVGHTKTAGTDHLCSQPHLDRKADEHALSHLKHVAELLEHVSKHTPFERLVLAGATAATSELFRLLPKAMRAKVVASAPLYAGAPESQILEEVLFIGRKAERTHEIEMVEILITASAKGQSAVTTLSKTLEALNAKRVREFVYAEGLALRGGVCEACDAVFSDDTMNCGFCGLPVNVVDDLIEAAIAKALAEGATVEQCRGEAAEKLKAAGGVGAFLRWRSASATARSLND